MQNGQAPSMKARRPAEKWRNSAEKCCIAASRGYHGVRGSGAPSVAGNSDTAKADDVPGLFTFPNTTLRATHAAGAGRAPL